MEENRKIEIEEYNPLPRKITTPILLIISIIFIAVGIIFINKTNNDKQYYRETSAVITSIDTYYDYDEDSNGNVEVEKEYDVYVTYSVDGTTYENVKLPQYKYSMEVGQTITITYDSRDPGRAINSAKMSYILSAISIVVGGLVGVSSIIYSIVCVKKSKQEKERINLLIKTGIVKRVTITFISETKYGYYFDCIVDGFEYSSKYIKRTPQLLTGCTVNIYFEKEGYEERLKRGKYQSNYFIDLNSVEEGEYIEPIKLI